MLRCLIIILLLLPLQAIAAKPAPSARAPLSIHTWVSYMPAWLLEAFTKETGIPVVVSFFADNSALYRRVKDEAPMMRHDIISPSGEMAERLANENLLLAFDHAKMPNLRDLAPWAMELPYDKGCRYSVPFFWGNVYLIIDKNVVPEAIVPRIKGFKDLWMPELQGKILLPNDFRTVMSVMLLTLGYSVNDKDMAHLARALEKLESLSLGVRAYDTVDQAQTIAKPTIGVAVSWNYIVPEGKAERYLFVFPEEGSPMWVDTLAIPATAPNPEGAAAFINFVFRPDILARLSQEAGCAVAGVKAKALVPRELRDNPRVYPPDAVRSALEPETMLPMEASSLERRWHRLKEGQ